MGPAGVGEHVGERLEDYLLGELSENEEFAVEAHLLACAACQTVADEQSELAALLALLPESVVETAPSVGVARRTGDTTKPPAPPSTRNVVASPGFAPQRHQRILAYALALVAGAAIGIGGWTLWAPQSVTGVPVDDATTDSVSQLSVTLQPGTDGRTEVQATMVGLRPGVEFELLVVTSTGSTHVLASGVAEGGVQRVVGAVPARADDILFLAAVQAGDVVLVGTIR